VRRYSRWLKWSVGVELRLQGIYPPSTNKVARQQIRPSVSARSRDKGATMAKDPMLTLTRAPKATTCHCRRTGHATDGQCVEQSGRFRILGGKRVQGKPI
jgi:hypothetical protein